MLGKLFNGNGGNGGNFLTGMVMNMAKSTLHLERDRPPTHKGTKFALSPASELLPNTIDIAEVPPVFDPDMAMVMRSVAMILTPGIVIPKSHAAMIIPLGPTLQAWYHLGCQTPWKQQIHLAVVVHPKSHSLLPAASPPSLAALSAQLVPHLNTILSDAIPDPTKRQCSVTQAGEAGNPVSVLQCNMTIEHPQPRQHQRIITLFLYIQVATEPPAGYKPVLIDGGVLTFVRSDKTQLIKEIQEWYKSRPVVKKNAMARRLAQNAHTHATAKLDMASRWRYDVRTKGFYKPDTARLAFMWPPSLATLKVVLILVVVLGLAYIVGLNIIPGLYSRKGGLNSRKGGSNSRKGHSQNQPHPSSHLSPFSHTHD